MIIIDHMLAHELSTPSKRELKGFGHNLLDLYNTAYSIGARRGTTLPAMQDQPKVTQEFVTLLSEFGITSRYYNLDELRGNNQLSDPLFSLERIFLQIIRNDVPNKQVSRRLERAGVIANALESVSAVWMQGLDQKPLSHNEHLARRVCKDLEIPRRYSGCAWRRTAELYR